MHYSKWATTKIRQIGKSVTSFVVENGLGQGTFNTAKRFDPTSANLVIFCEIINEKQGGDKENFHALLLEALKATRAYHHAVERIEANQK